MHFYHCHFLFLAFHLSFPTQPQHLAGHTPCLPPTQNRPGTHSQECRQCPRKGPVVELGALPREEEGHESLQVCWLLCLSLSTPATLLFVSLFCLHMCVWCLEENLVSIAKWTRLYTTPTPFVSVVFIFSAVSMCLRLTFSATTAGQNHVLPHSVHS